MMKSSTRLSSKHIYCLHVPSTASGYKQIFFPADIDTLQKVDDIHQAIFSWLFPQQIALWFHLVFLTTHC